MSDEELEKRVESLESEVQSLRDQVERLSKRPQAGRPRQPAATSTASSRPAESRESAEPLFDFSPESLITKIGVALVLLGVAFLLKYSYEQGWLTEPIRVGLGFLTGGVLLGAGFHQRDDNPNFASVLMGGAIASFYGSIFAANSLYDLMPWVVALAAMIGTTMLGFVLALRQDQSVLSCIAAIGGFATPFVLDGADDASMLEIYTLVMLAGTTAIYLFRGWRPLLLTTALGAMAVLVPAAHMAADGSAFKSVMVVAVIFALVVSTSLIPAVRASIHRAGDMDWLERTIAIVTPMAAIPLLEIVADERIFVVIVGTGVMAAVFFTFHSISGAKTKTYLAVGAALAAASGFILLGVEPLAMALAGLAVTANVLAREDSELTRIIGYAALAVLGIWTFVLLLSSPESPPFMTPDGLQMIVASASLLLVAWTYDEELSRWVHIYVAILAVLSTLAHQLSGIGEGLATATWGLLAMGLLVLGFVQEHGKTQILGVVVITLAAGKLLIFDLETVATIWRVALFMAFGAAMLAISFWRGLQRQTA